MKQEELEIAMLTSADAPESKKIAVLHALSWGCGLDEMEIRKRTANLTAEVQGLDPAQKAIFVARKGPAVVGFFQMLRDAGNRDHWWLAGVMVHPARRRRGIGRALIHEAIAFARPRGATVLRSETHVQNAQSIGFHEAIGFTNDGSFTAADGDHKIAFSRRLA